MESPKTPDSTLSPIPKVSWLQKLACWFGWHQWKVLSPKREVGWCIGAWFSDHNHRTCLKCGVVEDDRCKECRVGGSGSCMERIAREERLRKRRANCCLHCPPEDHVHACRH